MSEERWPTTRRSGSTRAHHRPHGAGSVYRIKDGSWRGAARLRLASGEHVRIYAYGKSELACADQLSVKRAELIAAQPVNELDAVKEALAILWDTVQMMQSRIAQLEGQVNSHRAPVKPSLRKDVLARDGRRCRYCGLDLANAAYELDHVVPVSRKGRTEMKNLVVACVLCNRRKHNALLNEIGMELLPLNVQ